MEHTGSTGSHEHPRVRTGAAPEVDGLTPGRLLGAGASGEVWTAVDSRTGHTVAMKVLRAGADGELSRREAVVLRRFDHPHVLRLLRTARTADSRLALVTEHAAGGSLGALVAARGPLDPGEVVTVLTPLATALGDLHERGVVHGDVSPANVLFLADGRPVLADLGTAGLLGLDPATHATDGYADPALVAGAGLAPASDVHALGAVAWFALTGQAPEPAGQRPPLIPVAPSTPPELASLVERCLDPQPRRRPGAAEVAVAAYRTADAVPVRLVPTDPLADAAEVVTHRLRQAVTAAAAEPAPARRRRWPWAVAAAAVVLVGSGAATLGGPAGGESASGAAAGASTTAVPTASSPASPSPASASPGPRTTTVLTPTFSAAPPGDPPATDARTSDDPVLAVTALSELRAQGFSAADPGPLRTANVDGSPALDADLATLAELDQQGIRLDGLRFTVSDAELLDRTGDTATVRVTVVTRAHRVVSQDDGQVVEEVEASGPAPVRLVLLRVDGGWRVNEVL